MGAVLRSAWAGFALPIALLAMVMSGAILTGVFYTATPPEQPMPATADLAAQASSVAEFGLRRALEETSGGTPGLFGEELGQPITLYQTGTGSATATYSVEVQELSDSTVLVRSEGRVVLEGTEAVRKVEAIVPIRRTETE